MEVGHRRANLQEQLLGGLQLLGILAVALVAEVVQGDRQHFGRRVEEADATALELLDVFRLEQQIPGVHRRGVAERGLDLVRVEADADRAPHVGRRVLVARVADFEGLQQVLVEVLPVGQLGLVQLLVDAGLDLLGEEVVGRHHDVVARLAGQQLGFQGLVAVVDVVDHLDAGLLLELLHGLRRDVVGPVVDVQHLVVGLGRTGHGGGQRGGEEGLGECFHGFVLPVFFEFFRGAPSASAPSGVWPTHGGKVWQGLARRSITAAQLPSRR
ncbi:hypothetical protein D3C81_1144590 [compost metagenome]